METIVEAKFEARDRASHAPARHETDLEARGDIKGAPNSGLLAVLSERQEAFETSALLAKLVEQTSDSVMLTDPSGAILYINPAFEKTSGYTREDAVGQTPRILKSGLHDDEFYRQMWDHIRQEQAFRGMVINRKKNGELYWAQQTISPAWDESGDIAFFMSVSQDITELRKKREQEFQLQLAKAVQQRFYTAPPRVGGFDIGASAHPADETGGDYFDFIPAEESMIVAVADAKGHGFGSALVMALTRAYVRCYAEMELELDELMARVNRMLLKDLKHGNFVTLFLARLDTKRRTLSYASAGHVPGIVLRESGEVKCMMESTGPPLGLFAASEFGMRPPFSLEPGELAVLLTDGVVESSRPDGRQFGLRQVLERVKTLSDLPAAKIADGIYHACRSFAKDEFQDDDITSVIIKAEKTG